MKIRDSKGKFIRGRRTLISCLSCEKRFNVIESLSKRAKFCSYGCYWNTLVGRKLAPAVKMRMSEAQKLKPKTKKELDNLKLGKLFRFKKGHKMGLGRKLSEETKEKLRTFPWPKGKDSHSWKGGKSSINHLIRTRKAYSLWRKRVYERDNFTCRGCGGRGIYIEAHHIKPVRDYPKLAYNVGNGKTLCLSCHGKEDKYRWHHTFR